MSQASFRPLSGYLISKSCLLLMFPYLPETVSVPSRGILFPNDKIELIDEEESELGFRPLSGYLISKSIDIGVFVKEVNVSVPSRGILFPNPARQSPLFCWLF